MSTDPSANRKKSDKTPRHVMDRRVLTSLENVGHDHDREGAGSQRGCVDEDGSRDERERERARNNL